MDCGKTWAYCFFSYVVRSTRFTANPGPVIVTTFPLKIAGPDRTEKLTGNPELAEADSVNGASPTTCLLNAPKVMVCGNFAASKLRSTLVAALKVASPACEARTVTVPEPVSVTTLLLKVAGPETMLNVTGKAELAVAVIGNGGSVKSLSDSIPKMIV